MNRTALWKHKPYTVYDPSGPPFPNVLLSDTDPVAGWTLSGITWAQNITGPQGQPAFTGTNTTLSQHTSTPPVSATGHYAGVLAKKGTNSWLGITCPGPNGTSAFDLTNGVVGTSTVWTAVSITPVGGGWYWCQAYLAAGGVAPIFRNADTQAHALSGAFVSTGTVLACSFALW